MNKITLLPIAIVLMCLMSIGEVAHADCVVNNQSYPEGAAVGGFVCKNDKWEKQ